jgi:hypothetical protein
MPAYSDHTHIAIFVGNGRKGGFSFDAAACEGRRWVKAHKTPSLPGLPSTLLSDKMKRLQPADELLSICPTPFPPPAGACSIRPAHIRWFFRALVRLGGLPW